MLGMSKGEGSGRGVSKGKGGARGEKKTLGVSKSEGALAMSNGEESTRGE